MILGNKKIWLLGLREVIKPFSELYLQPASYDVGLGSSFLWPVSDQTIAEGVTVRYERREDLNTITLKPGDFCLASTIETLALPTNVAAQLAGKSTLGRWGLAVHVTAGFIDPGFVGKITLELANIGTSAINLHAGQRIAQLQFYSCLGCTEPYSGKYQWQDDVTGARTAKDVSHDGKRNPIEAEQ
jgi:dCTP deaminase